MHFEHNISDWSKVTREELLHQLREGWDSENAKTVAGIKILPAGETNLVDYIMSTEDLDEMRLRTKGVLLQLIVDTTVCYIFIRNLILSIRRLYSNPTMLATWCCLIQAAAGIAFSIHAILMALPTGATCRHVIWNVAIGLAVSPVCVGIVLLHKAYLVHDQKLWILIVGSILLLPQIAIPVIIWMSPAGVIPVTGCFSYYPLYFPFLKLALDLPINILFSVAFIIVVYRYYRRFGSSAWGHLMRNGIQIMCLVVFTNVFFMFLAAFEVFGLFSEMMFILDWGITSLLLVYHCGTLKPKNVNLSNQPRTRHVMLGFSQIETAPTELVIQDNKQTQARLSLARNQSRIYLNGEQTSQYQCLVHDG
jgi:hypothetical protein